LYRITTATIPTSEEIQIALNRSGKTLSLNVANRYSQGRRVTGARLRRFAGSVGAASGATSPAAPPTGAGR
jgi:hypothetical protein